MLNNEYNKLLSVVNLNLELSKIKDYDILLETILTQARKLVNSDAGTIYTIIDEKLKFKYSQNDSIQDFKKILLTKNFNINVDKSSLSGYVASTAEILNIEDVYKIDDSEKYYFNQEIDKIFGYKTKSVLTVPLKDIHNEVIGVFQLINKIDSDNNIVPFTEEEIPLVYHFAILAASTLERAQLTRDILLRMIKMAELRDPKETGTHVNRVASYAAFIYEKWAEKNNKSSTEIMVNKDILRLAAMLHDVGKISITDNILKKNGKLTDVEFDTMKYHTIIGAKLFLPFTSELDKVCAEVALNHHEKWNGRGYPGHFDITECNIDNLPDLNKLDKKKGTEIPLFGRIAALADVYDALGSKRSYKEEWSDDKILDLIKKESGEHFDPELVEIFLDNYESIKQIRSKY